MKTILYYVVGITLLLGCQNEFNESIEPESSMGDVEMAQIMASSSSQTQYVQANSGLIELGSKLKNPYKLSNMLFAYDYLRSKKQKPQVKPYLTDYYVKITPRNHKDLQLIETLVIENKIVVSPVPIDYEIIKEGEWYVDKAIDPCTPELTPLYTSIPAKSKMLQALQYEIIDQLYLPQGDSKDELLEVTSLFFTDNLEEASAYNLDKNNPDITTLGLFGKRWRPSGRVKVETGMDGTPLPPKPKPEPKPPVDPCDYLLYSENSNNQINAQWIPTGNAPLEEAMINIGRWFKWSSVYTDNSGNFTSTKDFSSKKVKVRAKWRGYTATIRGNWHEYIGIGVYDGLGEIRENANNVTFMIQNQDQHRWLKATLHNGLVHNNQYYDSHNLPEKVDEANIWIVENDEAQSGATLMFDKYPYISGKIGFDECWWFPIANLALDIISIVTKKPDMIFQLGGIQDTDGIERIAFHESAHFAHAMLNSSVFWQLAVEAEITNICFHGGDPYGDGTTPDTEEAELIGLIEGWANFMEFKMGEDLHGRTNYFSPERAFGPSVIHYDEYWQFTTPMTLGQDDFNRWFMTGIFNDLNDNRVDQIRLYDGTISGNLLQTSNDNFQLDGGSLLSLVESLEENRYNQEFRMNPEHIRGALVEQHPAQVIQINQMFQNYGY